jgi:predicted porin
MMKKSLIALAVLAAAPAAFAATSNVDVSGYVRVYLTDSSAAATDYAPGIDSTIAIKAKEDLGGGMAGFVEAAIDMDKLNDATDTDTSPSTASSTNLGLVKDLKVGISSSMGTVVVGRMEYLVEAVVSEKFNDGLTSTAHAQNDQVESANTKFGRTNAIAYVSPDWNGFHFAVAGNLDGASSGLTQHTDLLAVYNNGPLTVMAGRTDLDAASGDITSLYAAYTISGVKLSAGSFTKDGGTAADTTDTLVRADYTMGPIDMSIISKSSDVANGDVTTLKATYNLSKRTSAYIGHRAFQGTTADQTIFGLNHSF